MGLLFEDMSDGGYIIISATARTRRTRIVNPRIKP